MFSSHQIIRCLTTSPVNGVLSGIRILDLTRVLAGPFCTMLLGDLGAEVIKIEKPDTGDDTRRWGPPFISKDLSCYYVAVNRNKKSVVIDLRQSEGTDLLLELAGECDVLIENYLPGKLTQMGVGYETVKQINPKIIYASISGFGSTGPYAKRAGYDVIAASIGGLLSITGPEDGDPCKPGVALTDLTTGLYTKSAILSALFHRERYGKGCKIDCNLLSSQVSMLTNLASNYLNCGSKGRRKGTAHESIVPYQAFKCKDSKWITIGALSDRMFAKMCQLIDLDDIIDDKRFLDNSSRVVNRVALIRLIADRIQTKSMIQWLNLFENSGFSYGPINDIEDVFEDKQVLHNNCVIELESEHNTDPIKTLGHAVKYQCEEDNNDFLRNRFTSPPALGEHTEQVLKTVLNYSDSQIKRLMDQNVIQ